jgi:hypothetical protein
MINRLFWICINDLTPLKQAVRKLREDIQQ